ncbi:MAG: hypothetical protein ACRDZO_27240 [Egibacteraceae bacterium]
MTDLPGRGAWRGAVAAEFDGRVTFVGVPGRGEVDAMRGFVADTGTGGFTHVVDDDGSRWQRFGIIAQPAFAFIDADGSVETFRGGLCRLRSGMRA